MISLKPVYISFLFSIIILATVMPNLARSRNKKTKKIEAVENFNRKETCPETCHCGIECKCEPCHCDQ